MALDVRMAPAAVVVWLVTALLAERPAAWSVRLSLSAAVLALLMCAAITIGKRYRTMWAIYTGRVVLICVVFAIGAAANIGIRVALVDHSPYQELAAQTETATIEASVVAEPRIVHIHGQSRTIYDVHLRSARTASRHIDGAGSATAFGADESATLRAGQRVRMRVRFKEPRSSADVATLTVMTVEQIRDGPWWWTASSAVRDAIAEAAAAGPTDGARIVPALIDGDQTRVDDVMHEDFRRSGLLHVMVVSGAKLTIVLASLLVIGQLCGIRRHGRWILGVVAIAAFVVLARPEPSVLRAAAMGIVTLAAVGYGGRSGIRCLCWGLIGLVLFDPWLARSIGFTLSVCATAGILIVAPILARRLATWMPFPLALLIAVPFAAQLACTPALAALSDEVSLVAVPANLLAAPVVAPATIGGLAAGLLWMCWHPLAYPIAVAADLGAAWVVLVARRASTLPGAVADWSQPWWVLIPACLVIIVLACWSAKYAAVLVGACAACVLLIWKPPATGWPPTGWNMVACDVGQGDATVLSVSARTAVVIDAGPEPGPVDQCLQRLGVDHIALMVFTHDHLDHTGGWDGVRRGRTVDGVLVGPSGADVSARASSAVAGDSFSAGSVTATILWPPPDWIVGGTDGTSVNNASLVMKVTTPELTMLLTGDIETEAQRRLTAQSEDLRADVLKMPHHGSARQSQRFFTAVQARFTTVSSGADNDYGHPAAAALRFARSQNMHPLRTDRHGDIAIVEEDGKTRAVTRR